MAHRLGAEHGREQPESPARCPRPRTLADECSVRVLQQHAIPLLRAPSERERVAAPAQLSRRAAVHTKRFEGDEAQRRPRGGDDRQEADRRRNLRRADVTGPLAGS